MSTETKQARKQKQAAPVKKKLKWIPAAQQESKDTVQALDEIRRIRFPAPTGKVGRPRRRPHILGLI